MVFGRFRGEHDFGIGLFERVFEDVDEFPAYVVADYGYFVWLSFQGCDCSCPFGKEPLVGWSVSDCDDPYCHGPDLIPGGGFV